MKRGCRFFIYGLLVFSFLLSGCTAAVKHDFWTPNADFLDHTITKAVNEIDELGIPKDNTIAIGELVSRKSDNSVPSALVYDELVRLLRVKSYRVLDRDRDTIRLMAPEAEDSFPLTVKPLNMGIENPTAYDAIVGDPNMAMAEEKGGNIIIFTQKQNRNGPESYNVMARLPKADYLLLYRILEVGVRYGDTEKPKSGMVLRRARVAFNYRVVSTSGGDVMWSGRVDTVLEDEIPSNMKTRLAQNLYPYYPHNHPDYTLKSKENDADDYTGKSTSSILIPDKDRYKGFSVGEAMYSDGDFKDNYDETSLEASVITIRRVMPEIFDKAWIWGSAGLGYVTGTNDKTDQGFEEKTDLTLLYVPLRLNALYCYGHGPVQPFFGAGLAATLAYHKAELHLRDNEKDANEDLDDATAVNVLISPMLMGGLRIGNVHFDLSYIYSHKSELADSWEEKTLVPKEVDMTSLTIQMGLLF